jgi:hypothetical protein
MWNEIRTADMNAAAPSELSDPTARELLVKASAFLPDVVFQPSEARIVNSLFSLIGLDALIKDGSMAGLIDQNAMRDRGRLMIFGPCGGE